MTCVPLPIDRQATGPLLLTSWAKDCRLQLLMPSGAVMRMHGARPAASLAVLLRSAVLQT